jgi:hypothetical protein
VTGTLLEVKGLHARSFTRDGVAQAVNGLFYRYEDVGRPDGGKNVAPLIGSLIPRPSDRTAEGVLCWAGRDLLRRNRKGPEQIWGNGIGAVEPACMIPLVPVFAVLKRPKTEDIPAAQSRMVGDDLHRPASAARPGGVIARALARPSSSSFADPSALAGGAAVHVPIPEVPSGSVVPLWAALVSGLAIKGSVGGSSREGVLPRGCQKGAAGIPAVLERWSLAVRTGAGVPGSRPGAPDSRSVLPAWRAASAEREYPMSEGGDDAPILDERAGRECGPFPRAASGYGNGSCRTVESFLSQP